MKYIAHRREDGTEETNKEHLEKTAELAGRFAEAIGFKEVAMLMGLGHDIGKYSEQFQKRIRGATISTDHSTAGAIELNRLGMDASAVCVAGHHGGLPDVGARGDRPNLPTYHSRLKKAVEDYSAFRNEVNLTPVREKLPSNGFEASFMIRMLFSCLVDADFIATETFMQEEKPRGNDTSITRLLPRLMDYVAPWLDSAQSATKKTKSRREEINEKRTEILRRCIEYGKNPRGIATLTVPTGGGKTISSLAYALTHAEKHGLDRVIVVVPYTSIIEQTADEYRKILGDENVIEHHSNVDYDAGENDLTAVKRRLACENWDAPIIVTTTVQLFESLFSNKPSRCRKLHNIARSVLIFDEAQMFPIPYLLPCVRAVSCLVEYCGCSAVLCSATQPALEKFFPEPEKIREICTDVEGLYTFFRRTEICWLGKIDREDLGKRIQKNKQVLTVVNTRRRARELYEMLPKEGSFCLTTLLTPHDRRTLLDIIRERLDQGEICRVVSTSLIEAGVDIDFPTVYREEAGLDSIIQTAGRCNRNGKHPAKESFVWVFRLDGEAGSQPFYVRQPITLFQEVAECYADLSSPQAIRAYFEALYSLKAEKLDEKAIVTRLERGDHGCLFPFARIAQEFHIIQEDTVPVLIVQDSGVASIAKQIRLGNASKKQFRQAAQYCVQVYANAAKRLLDTGDIEYIQEGFALLKNKELYHEARGLKLEHDFGEGLFV